MYVLYSTNVWNLYQRLMNYFWSLWCFIVSLNHDYDKFYLLYLEWNASLQIYILRLHFHICGKRWMSQTTVNEQEKWNAW